MEAYTLREQILDAIGLYLFVGACAAAYMLVAA